MDNIPTTEEPIQKVHTKGSVFKTPVFAIPALICAIIIIFAILNYFVMLPVSRSVPSFSSLSNTLKSSLPLKTKINICTQQHTGYPLLSDILTTKSDPNLGVYQGFIRTFDSAAQSLTIASKPSGNIFIFPIQSSSPILYDYHRAPVTDFSTIQSGTKAFVSFPCVQQNGSFTITRVQMVMQ